MIQVENTIISISILEKQFLCDLNSCKGACCVEGDSGAPITNEEEKKINTIYEELKPYMRDQSISEIEKKGIAIYDSEGDLTTTLVNNRECVFVVYDKGIAKCAIEKAYIDGKVDFKKPISCQLFPIRITEYSNFDAVNYEEIKICKSACKYGKKNKVPLYIFLREALIQKYGKEWYVKFLKAVEEFIRKDN